MMSMYFINSNCLLCRANDDIELGEEAKQEANTKRVVIDKETGKAKEVDIYDRQDKKKEKDPEKMKAIFSSTLEQSIIPDNVSKFEYEFKLCNRAKP